MANDRTIRLCGTSQRDALIRIAESLPIDGSIEVVIREWSDARSASQNARQWAATLSTISEQAWFNGRQLGTEMVHELCKRLFLPEINDADIEKLVKNPEKWRKWEELPNGELICVGSTTKLTKRGFAEYMTKVEAWAARELGVMFAA